MPKRLIPPALPLPARFAHFDDAVDQWFEEHLRGRTIPDRVMYTATELGDHGLLWLLLGVAQAARRHNDAEWSRSLLRTALGLGIESAVVNGPVKMLFRRTRPVHDGPRPHRLRNPRSSSFPSGHATAAFFGAALLRDGDPWWPAYYVMAVIVAASRVHVKIHHGSDVIGGVVTGVILGELTRRFVPVGSARTRRLEESKGSRRG
jgi:undecaprenyl-diphosphatase